jgi:D-alanyl-D-alanine carboxypeptidase (penicillin-binding protein 5/6)
MDTIRNGAFGLTNTNRLVRFYKGATGLKTGSTAKAGFCISATAEREGMTLICVIMASPTRDARNGAATALLDYGFSNFARYTHEGETLTDRRVTGGASGACTVTSAPFTAVVKKADRGRVERRVELPEVLEAPIAKGETVGSVIYSLDGEEIGRVAILADRDVPRIGFWDLVMGILKGMSIF